MAAPHVYVDVDDVLSETTRALARLAATHFGRRVDFEDMADFDLARSLGLAPDEYARFMDAAHEEAFLLDLPAVQGSAATVAAWHGAGAEISVVTGRPPGSRQTTARWLGRAGVPYHRLELVDKYGRYAGEAAARREDLVGRGYALVVEDSAEMAHFLVAETDACVLLVDRPWNRSAAASHPRVRRVHDWRAIAEIGAELHPALAPALR